MTALQRLMFRIANGVVVFSESEVSSIPNQNVFVAFSNYRDFDIFEKRIPFSERPVDIGFIGRFNKPKGVRRFAEAALALVEGNPNLTVRIVGDGPQYESVERMTANHDQVTLPGWIPHDEIATEYNRMQILVAPSKAEGLPTGLIEAMGCGVLVLATPVGSVGDLITDTETGFLLSARDPNTIVDRIEHVQNRNDLITISEQARKHVASVYSKQAAQERFSSITAELLPAPKLDSPKGGVD